MENSSKNSACAKAAHPNCMAPYKINIRNISIQNIFPSKSNQTNPYVVFKLKHGKKSAMTSSKPNTCDTNYDEILTLDGFYIGSDALYFLICNQKEENQNQDPDQDECLAIEKMQVTSLEFGNIKLYSVGLYKTTDGYASIDPNLDPCSGGILHFELQISKPEIPAFQLFEWKPANLYRLWFHIEQCQNVPLNSGCPQNPFITTKIGPCANTQHRTTAAWYQSTSPVWNILHGFYIDDYTQQAINVKLMHLDETNGTSKQIAKLKIPMNLAKLGEVFSSQMIFPIKDASAKPCNLSFRIHILPYDVAPFENTVCQQKDKLTVNLNVLDLKNVQLTDVHSFSFLVQCGNNKNYTEIYEIVGNNVTINRGFTFYNCSHYDQLYLYLVHEKLIIGQLGINLINYPLNTENKPRYFQFNDLSLGEVQLDLSLTKDDQEHSLTDVTDNELFSIMPKHIPFTTIQSNDKIYTLCYPVSHNLISKATPNSSIASKVAGFNSTPQSSPAKETPQKHATSSKIAEKMTAFQSSGKSSPDQNSTSPKVSDSPRTKSSLVSQRLAAYQNQDQSKQTPETTPKKPIHVTPSKSITDKAAAFATPPPLKCSPAPRRESDSLKTKAMADKIAAFSAASHQQDTVIKRGGRRVSDVSHSKAMADKIAAYSSSALNDMPISKNVRRSSDAVHSKSLIDQLTNSSFPESKLIEHERKQRNEIRELEGAFLKENGGLVCEFDWGSNNSDFSTSFTGYSECSMSLGSDVSESSDNFHKAELHIDNDKNYQIKPEWHQKIVGTFQSVKNLSIMNGQVYATVQLRGKCGLKHFKFITNSVDAQENPDFSMNINFDRVKKGDLLEIVLYHWVDNEKDAPIGYGSIQCKTLNHDKEEEYRIKLERPPLFISKETDIENDDNVHGEVQLIMNSSVEFRILE